MKKKKKKKKKHEIEKKKRKKKRKKNTIPIIERKENKWGPEQGKWEDIQTKQQKLHLSFSLCFKEIAID